MGVLVFAVPGPLVVVLGYAVGYTVAGWFGASPHAAETVGWTTGLVLLAVAGAAGLRWWRRRAHRM